jgi:hypothetical protein
MSKSEKLLHKAMNNPIGLNFEELKTLMVRCGWVFDRQPGSSHEIWYSPKGYMLAIQNRHGKAKGYQVKQFLVQYAKENENV